MYQPHAKLSASPKKKRGQLSNWNPGSAIANAPCRTGKDGRRTYPSTQRMNEMTKEGSDSNPMPELEWNARPAVLQWDDRESELLHKPRWCSSCLPVQVSRYPSVADPQYADATMRNATSGRAQEIECGR